MSLRLRLIVAFFLFSVVPLAAVTFYSYTSNERALQVAAQHETEMLTGELTQRMQVVTTQISERVEHLMDMPMSTAASASTTGTSGKDAAAPPQKVVARAKPAAPPATRAAPAAPTAPATTTVAAAALPDAKAIEAQVAASLGDVAMLLNNVEVRGMGGRFGGRGFPGQPGGTVPTGAGPGGTLPSRPAPAATPGAETTTAAQARRPFQSDRSMSYVDGRRGGRGYRPDAAQPSGQREGDAVPGVTPGV